MFNRRMSLLLEDGRIVPPPHSLVVNPGSDTDLSLFPKDGLTAVEDTQPVYDRLVAEGVSAVPSFTQLEGRSAFVALRLPRSRDAARVAIANAVALVEPGALVLIDGQKTDGVDSIYKEIRKRVPVLDTLTKAHGRSFWFEATDAFADWAEHGREWTKVGGYVTAPGVFSADGIDPGSDLLADALPDDVSGYGADLGAGWGYLSAKLLRSRGVAKLDLVEASHLALSAARLNVTDERAAFHWADATSWTASGRLDFVVTNPPFHTGRKAEPELGKAFIRSAAKLLKPSGRLFLVANRHLPYEAILSERFGKVDEISGNGSFKVIRASKPGA
ncbi:class I SAM-dependent methyltransferase [Qingshengfaniella alkalisoli]|uniref:Class I SAM-dependent methyltransferase n=1 Tax=Qingshengfaniella alkalisoli TaxID=2599296 RepID=A0A5B8IVW1_9RHOB|nr:class I SAM-dependent methyltransferase [Qingshengfaniella alkalisoli]QDY68638.1 class I SAM-dependent methyltransferase [Qingshengfaniella alkalisoli]